MKTSNIVVGLGVLSLMECIYAYPGMANTISEIERRAHKRELPRQILKLRQDPGETDENEEETDPNDDGSAPGELIGDIKDGGTTPIGKTIARILLEQESGQSLEAGYKAPGPPGSVKCKKDTCCIWAHVSAALTQRFTGPSGRCNKFARAAVRLGFHDAGTWSKKLSSQGKDFGGADGSIVLAKEEMQRPENNGLQDVVKSIRQWQGQFGVGMADLVQFAAQHAVVSKSFLFPSSARIVLI